MARGRAVGGAGRATSRRPSKILRLLEAAESGNRSSTEPGRARAAFGYRLCKGQRTLERGAPVLACGAPPDDRAGVPHPGAHAGRRLAAARVSQEAQPRCLTTPNSTCEWQFGRPLFNI